MDVAASVRRAVGRVRRAPAGHATTADVVAAYRLLLGREPDPEGLEHWSRILERGVAPEDIARAFLASPEYAARRAATTGVRRVEVDGVVLHVRHGDLLYGADLVEAGRYAPHVTAVVRDRLRPGATFLDVGANIGWFTLLGASLVGPAGRVLAVEPLAANVALLRRSIEANGFRHVELHRVAAAEAPGTVYLAVGALDTNARVAETGEAAPAVPLDDLLWTTDRLDLVKIDVEGYEVRVVAGARGLLERLRPPLVVEVNPAALRRAGHDPGELPAALAALGYGARVIAPDGSGLEAVATDRVADLVEERAETHLDVLFEPRAA